MGRSRRPERRPTPLQQLVRERESLGAIRADAEEKKARLRAAGCDLPFFDYLDPYGPEFARVVGWALATFPTLQGVHEVPTLAATDFAPLGVPAAWSQVFFDDPNPAAATYTNPRLGNSPRGNMVAFLDPGGGMHTVVRVVADPECDVQHPDLKYGWKLAVLLHELGHVKDNEGRVHFDHAARTADMIGAEVYANVFCLTECFARGYHQTAELLLSNLRERLTFGDHNAEVARRVLDRFQVPAYRRWNEYLPAGGV